MRSITNQGNHKCLLERKSDTCLPKLSPQTGTAQRFLRNFKKLFLVSTKHYLTKKYFRSHSNLLLERKRHIRTYKWYIIHPFSVLGIFIEIFMSICWLLILFIDPLNCAFFYKKGSLKNNARKEILILLDVISLFFIFVSFSLGYANLQTNEVILHPRKIAMRYVSSFLIFDLLGCIPLHILMKYLMPLGNPPSLFMTASFLKMTRNFRLKTVLEYSRQITYLLRRSDTFHKILCLVIICFYLIHWCACILFLIPKLEEFYTHRRNEMSWTSKANTTHAPEIRIYIVTLHTAMCHFFTAGTSMFQMEDTKDQFVCCCITLTGFFFMAYMTANVLQLVSSTSASESKYEQLVHTLMEFSKKKKLTPMLKFRLLLYYENRFQKKYFREFAILNTLSEHLRYEILLHSCKHLFDKLVLFQGLSKTVLGTIIACLTQEVYLPNDVVFQDSGEREFLFLVAHGTLAVYTKDGIELNHIEDGDHFGEVSLVKPGLETGINIVAIETSEIFRMDKSHFLYVYQNYDDFAKKVNIEIDRRLKMLHQWEDHSVKPRAHDILINLREGKILEKNRTRK